MNTTYKLYLRYQKQKENGEIPVYLRITSNRKSRYLSTGVSVKENLWNQNLQQVRKSHPLHKALNKKLTVFTDRLKAKDAELAEKGISSAFMLQKKIKEKDVKDFFDYADELIQQKKDDQLYWGVKQTKTAFHKLERFNKSRNLPFSELNAVYLERFQRFLSVHEGNKPSTIRKIFQPIKRVIRRAVTDRQLAVDPLLGFEIIKNSNPPERTKLSIDQIRAIEAVSLDKGSAQWHARNAFLFSFYSGGIRFGDICTLTFDNVKDGRLIYRMNKNEKQFSTSLNTYQRNILAQYSGDHSEWVFPYLKKGKKYNHLSVRADISSKNTIVNKNLQKIVNKVNKQIKKGSIDARPISDKVSFHVSRHSFAQYAVESGLDVYELMHALRHSKIETTGRYLKTLNQELADRAMNKVFE